MSANIFAQLEFSVKQTHLSTVQYSELQTGLYTGLSWLEIALIKWSLKARVNEGGFKC
jgi:hypothetical protein